MLAFRTCDEADELLSKISSQASTLACDALFTPLLRDLLGDLYPDTVLTLQGRGEILDFTARFDEHRTVYFGFPAPYKYYYWDGLPIGYDDRFQCVKQVINKFTSIRLHDCFKKDAFAWYWRKDWIAACVVGTGH
jgi:hypothetical protein